MKIKAGIGIEAEKEIDVCKLIDAFRMQEQAKRWAKASSLSRLSDVV